MINPKQVKLRQEVLQSNKINEKLNNLIIAYFSDLHFGNFIDETHVQKVVDNINKYQPDIIIFGGDLIDHYNKNGISEESKENLINLLNKLSSKYGKYAVYGNHDFDLNEETTDIKNILELAGFKVLDNENKLLCVDASYLNLIGLNSVQLDLDKAFDGVNEEYYSLLIAHFPDDFKNAEEENFDYMLAGHSHNGQIYIPLISLFSKGMGCHYYFRGKYTNNNKTLDITNGAGTTKLNGRFLADNEVVIYRLQAKAVQTTSNLLD